MSERDVLSAQDGEQLQLLVALAARLRGVDEQPVRLVRVEQCLAGQFQGADLRMDEVLDVVRPDADLVVLAVAMEMSNTVSWSL